MSDEGSETTTSGKDFADVLRVYCAVLAVIIVAAVVAQFVGIVAELLYAIVAFLFFYVPSKLIQRSGESSAAFGVDLAPVLQGLGWGVLATALTIPFFVAGYWVWETYILEREYDPDVARYRQWSVDLDGEPASWGQEQSGVWVWSSRDELRVGLRNDGGPNNRVIIEGDRPFVASKRGTVVLNADGREEGPGAARRWIATLTHSQSRGVVTIRGPDSVRVRVEPITPGSERWKIYKGPGQEEVEGDELSDERGLGWLLLWVATQFILVAFPEEFFYRGWIQTKLERGFLLRAKEAGREPTDWFGFTPAIFWTSILFGIGHLVVPVGGVLLVNRMSVFFPSLIFGWLRRHTGSILASTIYHACSNLMVLVAAVHFV